MYASETRRLQQNYWIVARDTFLTYPDFNKIFKIHTNASAFQLGAVVSHK